MEAGSSWPGGECLHGFATFFTGVRGQELHV